MGVLGFGQPNCAKRTPTETAAYVFEFLPTKLHTISALPRTNCNYGSCDQASAVRKNSCGCSSDMLPYKRKYVRALCKNAMYVLGVLVDHIA